MTDSFGRAKVMLVSCLALALFSLGNTACCQTVVNDWVFASMADGEVKPPGKNPLETECPKSRTSLAAPRCIWLVKTVVLIQ
jgi:hypothetical protein